MKNQNAGAKADKSPKAATVLHGIAIFINLLSLCCGIAYLIHPTPYLLWNSYGYFIFAALLANIVSAGVGGSHRYIDYCYLLLNNLGMFMISTMNTAASSDVQNKTSQSIMALVMFDFIFLAGAISSGFRTAGAFRDSEMKPRIQIPSGRVIKNFMRRLALVLLFLYWPAGLFISYILLIKSIGAMIEGSIPEYAIFGGFLILSSSVLAAKLRWRKKGSLANKIIIASGILFYTICLAPLASIPSMIDNAEKAYRDAFGNSGLDEISDGEQYGFMKTPFSMQDYFFGMRTLDYEVEENILYYEGAAGADAGIKLYFDAYAPIEGNASQPDGNSVLIRIHGGSWTMGDKGASNYSAENKHFASQGYSVFDIQYGLNGGNESFVASLAPKNVKGDFDIDDMVRHIGIFTTYLAEHAGQYNANLGSVFISGSSAGGQLATALALGITSGKYIDILDPRLNIKGLIPFYPANGLPGNVGIGGASDLVDPISLVGEDSPPCLIYQGTRDGIVYPEYTRIFQKAYADKSKAPCALLWMTFATHGSDAYTPGYYNQVFTYYMERFMHQFR
ncbi:MAG: alpha/beta hydrolase [Clostridiales bacterium]|jgi:acetyl esterase/lipase|nr:alpha/beta hydrolase [Clostridiales bacterium]